MSSPITKIVRFTTADGSTHLGEPIDGTEDAHVLTGDLFTPSTLQRTGAKATIRKYLTPLDPISMPCVGLNYRDHAHEANMDLPKAPMIFHKNIASANLPLHPPPVASPLQPSLADWALAVVVAVHRSVAAHGDTVVIPKCCQKKPEVDWEAEVSPTPPPPPSIPFPLLRPNLHSTPPILHPSPLSPFRVALPLIFTSSSS